MAPQSQRRASASLRYKSRPSSRVVVPFRDDQSLIALRYEQTVQAEPPIPIIPVPPRNPARPNRPASSVVSGGPVIVAPPPMSPHEQHPAFRIRERRPSVVEEDWKRDSGMAPTSSSVTIHEECEQEDLVFQKVMDEPEMAPGVTGDAQSFTSARSRDTAVTAASDAVALRRPASAEPNARSGVPKDSTQVALPAAKSPTSPTTSLLAQSVPASPTAPDAPASAGLAREASKRVVRAFSLRPNAQSKRLRKRDATNKAEAAASPATPPKSPPPLPPKDEDEPWARQPWGSKSRPPKSPKWQLLGFGGRNKAAHPCRSLLDMPPHTEFLPIDTAIPTDSLLEDDFLSRLTFSTRGSMMFGGKRAFDSFEFASPSPPMAQTAATDIVPTRRDTVEPSAGADSTATKAIAAIDTADVAAATCEPTTSAPVKEPAPATSPRGAGAAGESRASASNPDPPTTMQVPDIRILPAEVERESQKVRSLYKSGAEVDWRDGRPGSSQSERLAPAAEVPSDGEENAAYGFLVNPTAQASPLLAPSTVINVRSGASTPYSSPSSSGGNLSPPPAADSSLCRRSSSLRRDKTHKGGFELAGGIEDWEDVDGADVDRYGFITPNTRRTESREGTPSSIGTTPPQVAPAPRKRNVLVKRMDPTTAVAYGSSNLSPGRAPSRKVSARSLNTQTSELSSVSRRSARSSVRAAANLLPHNRDRRLADEAGDMLSMSPGLSDIAEDEQVEKMSEAFKRKEWERAEKWRKMAKVTNKGQSGEGMEFEFDVRNPKLVERTWKGIPDRWRAAAWFSFLATSARQHGCVTTDAELAADFRRLQDLGSPDDTQIDLDVPRTINRHIMFRRRYRGGQRLLFRVLHALSLHFPDTGYVQGMASLAATLLCYFDEERSFIMLVRMWRFRGLERLYQPGFDSLMASLRDLERDWLGGKEVARKLSELCIDATAYATRWYLTLFNLSIPFPAQLRVWDVFMLLGEPSPIPPPPPAATSAATATIPGAPDSQPSGAATVGASSSPTPRETPLPGFDILHATATALIHALTEVLLDSDFENAMKALTSWIPVKDEELLMKVARDEWRHHQAKKKT